MKKSLEHNASFQEEYAQVKDVEIQKENDIAKDNPSIKEFDSASEENKVSEKKPEAQRKERRAIQTFSGSLIGVVAAATVGITSLVNVTMKASFVDDKMIYRDGTLYYEVEATDMTEKETLTLYMYDNGEQINSFNLVDDDKDGIIDGEIKLDNEAIQAKLEADPDGLITYDFSLKGVVGLDVERSFDNYKLEIQYAAAEIIDVERKCNCGTTGYYNFKVNFNDPFGTFFNFYATMTTKDSQGNDIVRCCEWSDNPHDWQGIYVADLGTITGKLTISIDSTIGENNGFYAEYDVRF